MYLPVVLLQRYGWPAAVCFTIPNVVGVILFGRFMRSASESRALVRRHPMTCVAFSIVTIAFHVFFLIWVWQAHFGLGWTNALAIGVVVTILAHLVVPASNRVMRALGMAAYGLSIALLVGTLVIRLTGTTQVIPPATLEQARATPIANVFVLLPMVFGFLLCPHADLTFHRAYQAVGGGQNGRRVFTMFGLFFAVMIGFTVTYALTGFTWLIAVHFIVQSWFTMGLHLRELQTHAGIKPRAAWLLLIWVGLPATLFANYTDWYVFYGLAFPMILGLSSGRRRIGRNAADTVTIAAVILISLPCDWFGFMGGSEWLLAVPVGLFVIGMLGGRRQTRETAAVGEDGGRP